MVEVNEKKRLCDTCVDFLKGVGDWGEDFVTEIFQSNEVIQSVGLGAQGQGTEAQHPDPIPKSNLDGHPHHDVTRPSP